jgi:hypothetical protein
MIEREVGDGSVRVTFSLSVSEGEVSVLGSFNDWNPAAHPLRGKGPMRTVTVELPLGSRHEFRYLGSDGRWFDDPDADAWDGQNSVLLIDVGLIDVGGAIAATGESASDATDATPPPAKRGRRRTPTAGGGNSE